jgi:hypothetical protein
LKSRNNELPVPTAISADDAARELARIWSVGDRHQFVLASEIWDDPAAWGLLLVDLARQAARAYAVSPKGWAEEDALARIKQGFDAEWFNPTE